MTSITKMKQHNNHLLEASKPPEGADVVDGGSTAAAGAGTIGTTVTTAGTGGAGEGSAPKASKPVSRRSFCTRAGARAGAAAGVRVGDINPEGYKQQDCRIIPSTASAQ